MIVDDIRAKMQHLPRKIMGELYCIEPNPQYTTLLLFLQYNYPQYNNHVDAGIIWDCAHMSNEYFLIVLKNL